MWPLPAILYFNDIKDTLILEDDGSAIDGTIDTIVE